MHWINALAMIVLIGSGWKIYNDEVLFGWLHFPDWMTIGVWAQHALQWHFFGDVDADAQRRSAISSTASPPAASAASCCRSGRAKCIAEIRDGAALQARA